MTNTKAIKELERQKMMFCHNCVHPQMVGWCENHCQIPEAYDMAINALKAQEKSQEVSNNSPELDKENGELISRQAVLDGKIVAVISDQTIEVVPVSYIDNIPPSPSRPKGRWKTIAFLTVECSECHAQIHELEYGNFCPNCGADMRQ